MSSTLFKKAWPYSAIILAHVIWAINFVIIKLTLQEIPPMSLAFLRFALASLFLLPFLIIANEAPWTNLKKIFSFLPRNKTNHTFTDQDEGKTQNFIDFKDLPKIIIASVLLVCLNITLLFLGLERTTVATASILSLIIPVTSVIIGWTILREKIYVVNIFGVLAGIAGAIAVLGIPLISIGAGIANEAMVGNILVILSCLSWVTGTLFSKQLLQKYSTLTITSMIFFIGSLVFMLPAINEFIQNPNWIQNVTFLGIFGVLYMTLASSISAYFLFQWGMDHVGLVRADLFQYIEPLIAISLGIFILGEQLRFSYVLGAILIALGVYWSTLAKDSHRHSKAHRH